MLDEMQTARSKAGKEDGGGGWRQCRHGALQAHTSSLSALTYFPAGFYLDQTSPCQKILFDFFFVGYL